MGTSRSSAQYMREYMAKYRAEGRDKTQTQRASDREFVAIDGEGGNLDNGYHAYFLLRAGEETILPREGEARLRTIDCLDFISRLDPKKIYVGYFFDYDVTKILEDLGWTKLHRLINRNTRARTDGNGLFPVDYRQFQVDYLPRKEFKVRRRLDETKWSQWITINDVGSFFQCRFTETLDRWNIGTPDERMAVARGKLGRATFQWSDLDDIATYNALEIKLLQEVMERFRDACKDAGYVPARWQGPGLLAEAMFAKHGIPRSRDVPILNDPEYTGLLEFARNAFYGGRPEIAVVGPVNRTVYQWDINAAYPYALQHVPCLIHGEWIHKTFGTPVTAEELSDDRAIYYGYFDDNGKSSTRPVWYGLPFRTDKGTITYPAAGRGWYWSFEIASAIHQSFTVTESWHYVAHCDCRPFAFLRDVYEQRRSMGKDGAGVVLKLGSNSCFGKKVQSIGVPKYSDPIQGSFITAYCRMMIQDFIHSSPYCREPDRRCGNDVLMIATDSVATFTNRTDMVDSKELGGWSVDEHTRGMFLVQPGLYFGTSEKPAKTRGVPREVIEEKEQEFREAFTRMVKSRKLDDGDVYVPQTMFVGIRNALHRHNLKLLGQWIQFTNKETGKEGKVIRFDWRSKRAPHPVLQPLPGIHDYIQTFPQEGSTKLETIPYSKNIGGLIIREEERLFAGIDEQPDWMGVIPDDVT